ncbi:hypothetical protein BDV93DRAFT_540117 [Ceratobasidium sp. AG-I]|nr:hypothetical protein BDV93DRAFT_540117 [Ceratobasidium sp. AG-I]
MDTSSSAHPSAHPISRHLHHDDPMGSAISAVRAGAGRISLKRRADVRHDDSDIGDTSSNRYSKRIREDPPSSPSRRDGADERLRDGSSPPPISADTTLVNDLGDEHDILPGALKGKARDDMCSSSVVSALLPTQDCSDIPSSSPDQRTAQLADEIESELRCGCCTEIAYNPVTLSPCHHFFCGSCMTLHLSHSRSAPNYTRAICPACRTPLAAITPSRVVQSLASALLRVYPERARTERERVQADEIYTAGRDIPIPPPRMPNPDVLLPQQQNSAADNLARPCPHCAPHNSFDWTCPQPIPNPDTDPANAWNFDNGNPPGHNYCGAWLLWNLGATRMIESGKVYEVFNGNAIEVEILFDYLREAEISPNMIYLDIIDHIRATPRGFEPLIASGIFGHSHPSELRIPDTQYAAARSGDVHAAPVANSAPLARASTGFSRSDVELPNVLFADFTDEEDSDGDGDGDSELSRRRTAAGANAIREMNIANGSGMMLPRFADLMRSMRDGDVLPPFSLPVGSATEHEAALMSRGALRAEVAAPSSSTAAHSSSASAVTAPTSASSVNPPATLPRRRRVCRECATEMFVHGLKNWWAREMATTLGKERLPAWVVTRGMCESGEGCTEQGSYVSQLAASMGKSQSTANHNIMRLTRRKSAQFDNSSRLGALPNELLYMIFYLTSFRGRASLVLSNKRFFDAFNPLLYQDLRLDNPRQLVQLYRSTVPKRKLRDAQALTLGSDVFSYVKWEEMKIRLSPAAYLARVLNEASSLRKLDISNNLTVHSSQWNFETQLTLELVSWAAKSNFLPKLASLKYSQRTNLLPLLQGRPIAYLATGLGIFTTKKTTGYRISELTPESAALELEITEHGRGMDDSAHQVGATVQEYIKSFNHPTAIAHLQIVFRFFWREDSTEPYKGNMFPWVQTMLSLSDCSQLKTLLVYFTPPLLEESLDEQKLTLQKLGVVMPSLIFVMLGSPEVEWRKHVPEPENASTVQELGIPKWTPRPDYGPEVLEWWLREFKLNGSGMEGDLERTAGRLRTMMRARWEEAFVPSMATLQAHLSSISIANN